MGSRAIYSVIENGEIHHFYSQWAANEYIPFAVIHTADNLNNELSRKQTTVQLMPMIEYNRRCYHCPPADFSVSITDGLHCLEQVVEECHSKNASFAAVIQREMNQKLKGLAVPLEQLTTRMNP